MMWWGHVPWFSGGGWLGAVIGAVFMVLFWGGLIAAVVWVVRALTQGGGQATSGQAGTAQAAARSSTARAILDERFARGEITAEEYRRMREELER